MSPENDRRIIGLRWNDWITITGRLVRVEDDDQP